MSAATSPTLPHYSTLRKEFDSIVAVEWQDYHSLDDWEAVQQRQYDLPYGSIGKYNTGSIRIHGIYPTTESAILHDIPPDEQRRETAAEIEYLNDYITGKMDPTVRETTPDAEHKYKDFYIVPGSEMSRPSDPIRHPLRKFFLYRSDTLKFNSHRVDHLKAISCDPKSDEYDPMGLQTLTHGYRYPNQGGKVIWQSDIKRNLHPWCNFMQTAERTHGFLCVMSPIGRRHPRDTDPAGRCSSTRPRRRDVTVYDLEDLLPDEEKSTSFRENYEDPFEAELATQFLICHDDHGQFISNVRIPTEPYHADRLGQGKTELLRSWDENADEWGDGDLPNNRSIVRLRWSRMLSKDEYEELCSSAYEGGNAHSADTRSDNPINDGGDEVSEVVAGYDNHEEPSFSSADGPVGKPLFSSLSPQDASQHGLSIQASQGRNSSTDGSPTSRRLSRIFSRCKGRKGSRE